MPPEGLAGAWVGVGAERLGAPMDGDALLELDRLLPPLLGIKREKVRELRKYL